MIDKKMFVETVDFLKKKRGQEDAVATAIKAIDPDNEIFLFTDTETMIVKLLNQVMDLESHDLWGTDLEYYIYEMEFGERAKHLPKDSPFHNINTSAKLYDFLLKEKKLSKSEK